ncbi:hypothetical protein TUBRATIS_29650 [Tubulinosema ratisbonensis]|uniref:Uncharacterized protein n=1 Tax=Tubulinosema ratisbonensis TaxID=291195 RepID=A0A437AHP8_9MICR|nr:hypothetical protein TUBRATIS_29650 [Tubulinosema ratisbonensis]
MQPLLIELALFLMLTFSILTLKSLKTYTINKTKECKLELILPKIINLFSSIQLKELLNNYYEYNGISFDHKLINYLNSNNQNDLKQLFRCINIDSTSSSNTFGVIMSNFLIMLVINPDVTEKKSNTFYSLFHLACDYENIVKTIKMLDYYYIRMKISVSFGNKLEKMIQSYAYNANFYPSLDKMVKFIYERTSEYSTIDREYGNEGIKFGKYLVIFFTHTVCKERFEELLADKYKSFKCTFKLIFVGVSQEENLVYKVLSEIDGFLINDYDYNFVIFENLNFQ